MNRWIRRVGGYGRRTVFAGANRALVGEASDSFCGIRVILEPGGEEFITAHPW
jgi:hypothetical protein